MTATSSIPSSGQNILNFSTIDSSGNVSNTKNSVAVTFNDSTHFTINGKKYTYDFTWGDYGSKQIILGNTNGGYFLLTATDINISNYTYGNYSYGSPNHWQVNGNDGTSVSLAFNNRGFDPCFLAGTEISVNGSFCKVEHLTVGDKVDALVNGKTEQKTVSWVGKSTCVVNPFLSADQAGYPVRILKDAIAKDVPFKDMLITPEHCLFLDGCFVPARMLVNGQSIFYDESFTQYDYYHIETEDHAIITADGVLTESYLDTGNRHKFRQSGTVLSIAPSRNLTWDDAAASLNVSRDFVEPLFRKLNLRAEEKGVPSQTEAPIVTNYNDLHLQSDSGHKIYPLRMEKDRSVFMIPQGVETVHIVSNESRPCDVIGPFVDDRRTLGVLVGDIRIFESNDTRLITSHLDDENLEGWNGVESSSMRWTSGNAILSLGNRMPGTVAFLTLQILASGPYLARNLLPAETALRA